MTDSRQNVSTGTIWEEIFGFSRVVKVGNQISVSGTTATDDDGNPVGIGDPGAQTEFIIEKIARSLAEVDASLEDIVRTRIYVANADDWEMIGHVHGKYFKDIRPANTLFEVSRIVGDEYLVEIEADAIIISQ